MLKIEITKLEKQKMIERTQHLFNKERDEDLGVIAAEEILDFFVDELSKTFYNKGLDDSRLWFKHKLEELDAEYDTTYK
jgi:uncharacterized protein (DUF2164 family)